MDEDNFNFNNYNLKTMMITTTIIIILVSYIIYFYISISNQNLKTENNILSNELFQHQIQKTLNKKKVCLVWDDSMILTNIIKLFELLIKNKYEIYLIIKTLSNDINSSKEIILKKFSIIIKRNLIKEHVIIFLIKISIYYFA